MSSSLPFYIVNAFTTEAFRGNPAVIVFVNEAQLKDTTLLQNIAQNFNQPMTAYLYDRSTADNVAFDIRWFTITDEVSLCGHATIAASGLLFSVPDVHKQAFAADVITYRTQEDLIVTARRAGDWAELTLPAAQIEPLPEEKTLAMGQIVCKALGKDVNVKFAGSGVGLFSTRLFVEIDVDDDLAGCVPNPQIFLETGYPTNIITSASSDGRVAFLSRMFAPAHGVPEDHVCGSAHCMLTPYWAGKLAKNEVELFAKQVSVRGGDIRVIWHKSKGTITLSGQTKVIMKGEVLL